MSLFYVTGTPGSGKTTIQEELVNRGYEAYDIDQPRFGGPVNLKTGERTTVPPIEDRSPDWFKEHEWRVSRSGVEQLKAEAKDKVIFLCGTTTTEHLVWDLFDKILFLNVDEPTLRHRILNRKDNDYGQGEGELEIIMNRYRTAQEKLPTLKVTLIDATGSIDETTEAVIKASKNL
jgi:dephospho-CoA kinase